MTKFCIPGRSRVTTDEHRHLKFLSVLFRQKQGLQLYLGELKARSFK